MSNNQTIKTNYIIPGLSGPDTLGIMHNERNKPKPLDISDNFSSINKGMTDKSASLPSTLKPEGASYKTDPGIQRGPNIKNLNTPKKEANANKNYRDEIDAEHFKTILQEDKNNKIDNHSVLQKTCNISSFFKR